MNGGHGSGYERGYGNHSSQPQPTDSIPSDVSRQTAGCPSIEKRVSRYVRPSGVKGPGTRRLEAILQTVLAYRVVDREIVQRLHFTPAGRSAAQRVLTNLWRSRYLDKLDGRSVNERDVFVTRFLAAAPHFYEDFGWWVRERYVRLAGRFGTTALVPALLEDLRRGLVEVDARRAAYDKAPALDDAAKKEQTKSAAQARLTSSVNAVVRLTGFDPRRDEHGVRPIEDVARELVRACAR